jgi:hypothetical protein
MSLELPETLQHPTAPAFEFIDRQGFTPANQICNTTLLIADQVVDRAIAATTKDDFTAETTFTLHVDVVENPYINRDLSLRSEQVGEFSKVCFNLNEKDLRQNPESKGPEFSFSAQSNAGVIEMCYADGETLLVFPWQIGDTVISARLTIDMNGVARIFGVHSQGDIQGTKPILPTGEIMTHATEVAQSVLGLLPARTKRNTISAY